MIYKKTTTLSDTKKKTSIDKNYICILYNETKKTIQNMEETRTCYEYDTIQVFGGVPTYDSLVSFLVRERYSQDNVESIINNYLEDTSNDTEFKELQVYRVECKELAKKCMELYNKQLGV